MSSETVTDPKHELADIPQKAVVLAAEILNASREKEARDERSRSAMMARMMRDEDGKKFTIAMADQVLRIHRPLRAAERMDTLVREYGVPKFFSFFNRMALRLGNAVAGWLPKIVMPLVTSAVRKDSAHVIIPAEQKQFTKYLTQRRIDNVRVNFNQLGEAVLGDHEADRRLRDNIERLLGPDIDYISIKLSSIVSQISLTGYQETLEMIRPRLREIYRAAIKGGGSHGPKFVNLDMEEYRDLHLTVDVFQSVLDEPEFDNFEAGIVLQAYLPDSYSALQSLIDWGRQRRSRTGTGIKIRLVKGANLAMEQVEASMRDWEQAPFHSKLEVDANFKRMLEFATRPENAAIVRIGVGSHNLFDIAFAFVLREQRGVTDRIEFEMLEGMANAQALEVRDRSGGLIVYTPVVLEAEFESAVAYLVRRLDENTAPGSFLGALFALQEGTPEWEQQKEAFLKACDLAFDPQLNAKPNRVQNRLSEQWSPLPIGAPFRNVADTDFSLPENRAWCEQIHAKWKDFAPEPLPLQVGGRFLGIEEEPDRMTGVGKDPSRPGHIAYRFAQGTVVDVESALETAVSAVDAWSAKGIAGRAEVLLRVAAEFANQRGETIGAMMLDAGKNITEADVEVSEAIDFANYYAGGLNDPGWVDGTQYKPCGVVVVTPPWNFPYAIPAGGVLAALMAGNAVILKPARETVLSGWMMVQQMWNAGVPMEVLQFMPTFDGATGRALVTDPRTSAVILTGSIFTAERFHGWRPDMRLFAETSGKNALIVTAAADLDLAVKDLVRGAFGHAGQKCSATSLGLIEKEVYDNPKFMNQLRDAAQSMRVGSSWDLSSLVTPVIPEPDEYLHQGLTQLEPGESWLLEPQMIDDNTRLWRPGIRVNVQPGSWYHQTECFGPVLGLIRVEDLDHAIEVQNSSAFGLTGGLHSLDPVEIDHWREAVEVGNAYVNRSTTGAIVQRQPFGGWKDSGVGPGPKAGGPNYVAAFCDWSEVGSPTCRTRVKNSNMLKIIESFVEKLDDDSIRKRLVAAAESYEYWWEKEFGRSHDPSSVHGETNEFRYRPNSWHVLRFQNDDPSKNEIALGVALACALVGTELSISVPKPFDWIQWLVDRGLDAKVNVESDEQLTQRVNGMKSVRQSMRHCPSGTLRIVGEYSPDIFSPSALGNVPVTGETVFANGRIELLNYLREQAVSETVHRYGNII